MLYCIRSESESTEIPLSANIYTKVLHSIIIIIKYQNKRPRTAARLYFVDWTCPKWCLPQCNIITISAIILYIGVHERTRDITCPLLNCIVPILCCCAAGLLYCIGSRYGNVTLLMMWQFKTDEYRNYPIGSICRIVLLL